MDELQNRLYAEGKQSLLVILQAMDAGGKDGIVKHVFGSLNPMGIRVVSFKTPSAAESAHDFLWRVHPHVPGRGEISLFNRSHYEAVLIELVHAIATPQTVAGRYKHIRGFEALLADSGTRVLKFWLHISRDEQRARFEARRDDPQKNWKLSAADVAERKHWDAYMLAYDAALAATSTPAAPWFAVPADHKLRARVAIARIVVDTLRAMAPQYPAPSTDVSKLVIE